jgi:cell division protein FtsB
MRKKLSDLDQEPNWHLDYRDPTSLPDDRVVRVRFLVNMCAGAVTLSLLIIVGWQLLVRHNLAAQYRYWDERIAVQRREYDELQLSLRDFMTEAGKIKDAYELIHSPFVASDFVFEIARTLPGRMTIDTIGYTDGNITMRGNLAESPEQASRVLGGYIETLRKAPQIGPLFDDISAPSLDRAQNGNLFNFEIVLKRLKSPPP